MKDDISNQLADISTRLDEAAIILQNTHQELKQLYVDKFGFWFGNDEVPVDLMLLIGESHIAFHSIAHRLELDQIIAENPISTS